jgi:hypothetical protein
MPGTHDAYSLLRMKEKSEELSQLQAKLVRLMEKKPK